MKKSTQFVWLIGIIFVVNLLWGNHVVSLWDEDEAAYAGFGMEILASDNWVNPSYQWSVIHRKTPFHFWTIALSFKLFGVHEFALRLPSVLAILLTCLAVWRMGRPLFGALTSRRAAVILATSIMLPLMGKIALTDASLLLFETTAVLSLLNFVHQPSWKWNVGLWLSIALGILVKGPPIILLTGGIWLLLALWHPKRKHLIQTHPWFWGLLALLPFAIWCYLSYAQDVALWEATGNGQAFEDWWQEEANGHKIHLLPFLWEWYVLRRIGGSVLGQSGFWGYHFVVLTIAFLTWLPFWGLSLKALFKAFRKPSDQQLMLLIWIVMGWLFWELMSSKLPSYSMGAQPALAFFMAIQIEKLEQNEQKSNQLLTISLGLYSLIFVLLILVLPVVGLLYFGTWTLAYLLPMSIGLGYLLYRIWQKRKTVQQLYQSIALFGAAFMFSLWACVSPIVEQSSIKSFDNVIETAYQLSNQNKDARLVLTGFDFKQLKISILVYAQQYFGAYEELHTADALDAFHQEKPVVLIIGEAGIHEFKAAFARENIPFDAQKILYHSTDDRFIEHNFWIISNSK